MTTKPHIYVISCGLSAESLSSQAREIINQAHVIAGGKRLLSQLTLPSHQQVPIGAQAQETVRQLIETSRKQTVVILASGDALYHGIATTLAKLAEPDSYTIIPNVTAFQALCAKIKITWSDADLFSIHGQNGLLPWRRILASHKAIVYCDNHMPAHAAAAELIRLFPATSARQAVIACNLGLESETIMRDTLKNLSQMSSPALSILMLLPPDSAAMLPPLPLGLDDQHYEHEKNLITHPEVRAVILSKLRLTGGTLWDLGAGSGSVGIEAAGLRHDLAVHAIEKDPARVDHIRQNTAAEGLSNHQVSCGNILEKMGSLPDPDRVFIGGGGTDIETIAASAFQRLRTGGRLVASAVTLETAATLSSILKDHRSDVITISVSRTKPAGSLTMMKADNPITIFTFIKD